MPLQNNVENVQVLQDSHRPNNYKVLILYQSGYGSTAEVAQKIGEHLSEDNAIVTVCELPYTEKLEAYDAIIVGSAIRYDRWMPHARKFIQSNQDLLSKLPVAFFFNCLTLARRTDETESKARQYADSLRKLSSRVVPLSIGGFGGVLDFSKMPFLLRLIFKIFSRVIELPEGDYRDWGEIRKWSKEVGVKLKQEYLTRN